MDGEFFTLTRAALMECGIDAKLAAVDALAAATKAGTLRFDAAASEVAAIDEPGRPARPQLVSPREVGRRNVNTREGHAMLMHALAHIEFNAINLALDCAWRFRAVPRAFQVDWIEVAAEEALHFSLLRARLEDLGHAYGDFAAHDGLWQMARRTAHDPLARMALVPRLLEARGLDVTPGIMDKLRGIGDAQGLAALEIVLRDEVGHVARGDRWFRHFCHEAGVDPEARYRELLVEYAAPRIARPLNHAARRAAGFGEAELEALEAAAAAGSG